jgi:hypothetical protein
MNRFVNNKFLKPYLIIVSAIIFPVIIYSQVTVPGAPVYRDIKAYDDHLTITSYEGGPFKNYYGSIEGSPFYIEHYCPANLKLNKGTEYQNILTKLDLYTHEIIVIDKDNREIITADGLVMSVFLTDTAGGITHKYDFRSGYPAIDKNNLFNYYQVLSDGKLQLLKHIRKEIVEEKNIQSGEIRKEFVTREEYYSFSSGEIKKLKREKDYIKELMKDQEKKITEYLKEKKVNFKNISFLSSLFEFYNTLSEL